MTKFCCLFICCWLCNGECQN